MCGFEIIAKPDKNKRDHLLKQLISIVSCRFCRAEYDNEILLPYHTSAVDKSGFLHGKERLFGYKMHPLKCNSAPPAIRGCIFELGGSIHTFGCTSL